MGAKRARSAFCGNFGAILSRKKFGLLLLSPFFLFFLAWAGSIRFLKNMLLDGMNGKAIRGRIKNGIDLSQFL